MHELTILSSGSVNAPVDAGTLAYTAGSLSGTLDSTDIKVYKYRLIGTVTLSGASSISYSGVGSPVKNESYFFHYEASVTPSGNTFSIFGQAVPSDMLASKFLAECVYDGSAWKVKLLPSFDGVGIIGSDRLAAESVTTAKIAKNAVTLAEMAGLAKGNIIYGDASGDPATVNLGAADANLIVGDTTSGVAVVAMNGDATISKAGALTIANDAISTVKIADDAVTAAKLDDDANRVQVVIPVSFESAGEIGAVDYKICFPCTIEAIHGTVTKPFTSTGTHVFKDNGGTVLTGSQIDMSSALLLGNIVSSTPTANNTFVAGDVIRIETSVSGAVGGKSSVTLCMLKS